MSNEKEKKLKFKYVDFDLPFVLFVKDSLGDRDLEKWAKAYASGERPLPYAKYAPSGEKPGGMIIGGGFPVYIPPQELAPYYEVTLPNITVGLRTLRRVNPHRSSILMGEIPGDRNGRASFSSIRVMFDLTRVQEECHWDMTLFCSSAIQAVNHFIEHYRVIADRPYVSSVTLSEIQEFHLTTEFDNGEQQHQEFGGGSGPLHGFGGALDDSLDSELRDSISRPAPPSIYKAMDANIRDYLDRQEWRLVVIEAAVLFEAWLSTYIRDKFTNNGISSSDIDAKFTKPNSLPKSVTAIASHLVLEATGFDFSASNEYTEWASKVRDLRNDLVHGKRFDVTHQEADEGYRSTLEAMKLLSTK